MQLDFNSAICVENDVYFCATIDNVMYIFDEEGYFIGESVDGNMTPANIIETPSTDENIHMDSRGVIIDSLTDDIAEEFFA